MIYLERGDIIIRDLQESDVLPLVEGEIAQDWQGVTRDKLDMRLRDAAEGRCIAVCALFKGEPAGYNNLYFTAYAPMDRFGYPEIVDFNVLEKFRCRGIGTALMDICEKLAAERSRGVTLGVGLHYGYGSAQRMYVKRGYIPDGTGVWWNGTRLEQYAACENDDDLNLYFVKEFSTI